MNRLGQNNQKSTPTQGKASGQKQQNFIHYNNQSRVFNKFAQIKHKKQDNLNHKGSDVNLTKKPYQDRSRTPEQGLVNIKGRTVHKPSKTQEIQYKSPEQKVYIRDQDEDQEISFQEQRINDTVVIKPSHSPIQSLSGQSDFITMGSGENLDLYQNPLIQRLVRQIKDVEEKTQNADCELLRNENLRLREIIKNNNATYVDLQQQIATMQVENQNLRKQSKERTGFSPQRRIHRQSFGKSQLKQYIQNISLHLQEKQSSKTLELSQSLQNVTVDLKGLKNQLEQVQKEFLHFVRLEFKKFIMKPVQQVLAQFCQVISQNEQLLRQKTQIIEDLEVMLQIQTVQQKKSHDAMIQKVEIVNMDKVDLFDREHEQEKRLMHLLENQDDLITMVFKVMEDSSVISQLKQITKKDLLNCQQNSTIKNILKSIN